MNTISKLLSIVVGIFLFGASHIATSDDINPEIGPNLIVGAALNIMDAEICKDNSGGVMQDNNNPSIVTGQKVITKRTFMYHPAHSRQEADYSGQLTAKEWVYLLEKISNQELKAPQILPDVLKNHVEKKFLLLTSSQMSAYLNWYKELLKTKYASIIPPIEEVKKKIQTFSVYELDVPSLPAGSSDYAYAVDIKFNPPLEIDNLYVSMKERDDTWFAYQAPLSDIYRCDSGELRIPFDKDVEKLRFYFHYSPHINPTITATFNKSKIEIGYDEKRHFGPLDPKLHWTCYKLDSSRYGKITCGMYYKKLPPQKLNLR